MRELFENKVPHIIKFIELAFDKILLILLIDKII